jgi:hypothetical protein
VGVFSSTFEPGGENALSAAINAGCTPAEICMLAGSIVTP